MEEEEAQASGAFMAYDPKLNEWEALPDPLRIKKDFFLGGLYPFVPILFSFWDKAFR